LPVPGRAREGLLTEPTADALLGILDCAVHIAFNPVTIQNHSGRADFELEHIPGAQFVDVLSELSDMGHPVPLMAPTASSAAAISFTCKSMTYAWRQGPGSWHRDPEEDGPSGPVRNHGADSHLD
jgi:hypothetical protein